MVLVILTLASFVKPWLVTLLKGLMVNLKRTREDILEAVLNTVHHKGLQATGLNELFAISGISSGSFYNYFGSKRELGHALIDFEWSKLKANILDPAVEQGRDPIDRVFWIVDRLEAKQLAQGNCAGCLLGNLIVDLVERDQSYREHLQRVFREWEEAIALHLRAGKARLQPQIDPEVLASQLLASLEGAMLLGRLYRDSSYIRRGFDGVRESLKASLLI